MRHTTLQWPYAIPTAHGIACEVSSWRGGVQLAAEVPVIDGQITYDDTATLRRRVSLTVPMRTPDGTVYDPADNPAAPLGAYGQRLHIRLGIVHATGRRELLDHGWYLITEWDRDEADHTVQVTAVDLAQLLVDARHYTTETPPQGATYPTEFARLADGILPVRVDPALPAWRVNPMTVWERDRDRNLDKLCAAWGARWFVDDAGFLTAAPAYADLRTTGIRDGGPAAGMSEGPESDGGESPTAETPVTTLHTGSNGTLVTRARAVGRDRLYNAVVATGKTGESEDGQEKPAPWAVAEITDPRSPIRVTGPYGRKPRFYQSDLMTTEAECANAAHALLTAASTVSRTEPVTAVPDPALELGDVVRVISGGQPWEGRITALTLPLTPGAMTVTLASGPRDTDDEGDA